MPPAPKSPGRSPARATRSPAKERPTKSPAKQRPAKSPAKVASPAVAMGTSSRKRGASLGGSLRWTPAEQARLRALALESSEEKDRWATIAAALGTGRSAAAIQQHYFKYCRRDMEDMASPEPPPPPPPPVNRQFVRTSAQATVDDPATRAAEARGAVSPAVTGGVASTATAAVASTVYFFAGPTLIFLNAQACACHAHPMPAPRACHASCPPPPHRSSRAAASRTRSRSPCAACYSPPSSATSRCERASFPSAGPTCWVRAASTCALRCPSDA